jgi:YggT family protein
MGDIASSAVLAANTDFVTRLVWAFAYVYVLLILLYVISSMLQLPYSLWLSRIQRFLYDVCEPFLRLFRRHLPQLGPLDLSPMAASITVLALARLVDALL